jgi:hypothetical protein
MIASTCLVVVFVPSFYVVMQSLEDRRTRRSALKAQSAVAVAANGIVPPTTNAVD